MWLLRTSDLHLKEFFGTDIPPYAILSHTWTDDEVTFQDIYDRSKLTTQSLQQKVGYRKVSRFCDLAKEEGYEWAWVDSCCIDKRSSAELSEAINSMYTWYKNAQVCMVYFSDVPGLDGTEESAGPWLQKFKASKWFTRGWTLQELIAPTCRTFFASDWTPIISSDGIIDVSKAKWVLASYFGDNVDENSFITIVSDISGINLQLLLDSSTLGNFCIAERMSWASRRKTTRPEDGAYSLMGLFDVNMPILYGEGLFNAFMRLQDEIMKTSFDQTIFAWRGSYETSGLLARSPSDFAETPPLQIWKMSMLSPFSMTNAGLYLRAFARVTPPKGVNLDPGVVQVALQCDVKTDEGWRNLLIHLQKVDDSRCWANGAQCNAYRRIACNKFDLLPPSRRRYEAQNMLVLQDKHYDLIKLSGQLYDQRILETKSRSPTPLLESDGSLRPVVGAGSRFQSYSSAIPSQTLLRPPVERSKSTSSLLTHQISRLQGFFFSSNSSGEPGNSNQALIDSTEQPILTTEPVDETAASSEAISPIEQKETHPHESQWTGTVKIHTEEPVDNLRRATDDM